MATTVVQTRSRSRAANAWLFGILCVLSYAFFSLVRDNTFWHTGDFLFLDGAIETGRAWKQIFISPEFQPFQPLVRLIFYLEYLLFGFAAWKYYAFNVLVHTINAYLVFCLVYTLLRDRTIAVLSSLLFVFAVGNYGKAVMVVSGVSDLLIAMLTLLTLLFYFKNELEKGGRAFSLWFTASLLVFLLNLLTKATSFSILGCIVAFHLFFRSETRKKLLNKNMMIMALTAAVALVVKLALLHNVVARQDFLLFDFTVLRNFGSYLVRMVFPIHSSHLVTDAGVAVRVVYQVATEIRVVTFLCILSYTVFGFVFGNRTIRFFIAWTYITLIPFCFFRFPNDWLNIRHLYLVSIGFTMILAACTVLASRLLYQKAWRRFLPYALPLLFVVLSQFIIYQLDKNYEATGQSPQIQMLRADLLNKYGKLHGQGQGQGHNW